MTRSLRCLPAPPVPAAGNRRTGVQRAGTHTAALAAAVTAAMGTTLCALPTHAADDVPITVSFAAEFGGRPFDCGTRFDGIGSTDASVDVADFRVYVSRVRLLDATGVETPLSLDGDGRWQGEGVALLDFEDATGNCRNGTPPTNAIVTGNAPAGDYTGVAFDIGVPFDKNHGDPTLAGSPLNLTGMFWNWRGGYRFMRVDLANVSGMPSEGMSDTAPSNPGEAEDSEAGHAAGSAGKHGDPQGGGQGAGQGAGQGGEHGGGRGTGWMLHIGSSGCEAATPTTAPSGCAAPNRIEVILEGFDPATNTVVIDPALALRDVDVSVNTPDTAPGCMSSPDDPECQALAGTLGLEDEGTPQTFVTIRE